jgi:hypothetical protein
MAQKAQKAQELAGLGQKYLKALIGLSGLN